MTRVVFLAIVLIVAACGCSSDRVFDAREDAANVTAGDIAAILQDSTDEVHEIVPVVYGIGSQLIEAAYADYRVNGLSQRDIEHLAPSPFRDNLLRLYRDLDSAARR